MLTRLTSGQHIDTRNLGDGIRVTGTNSFHAEVYCGKCVVARFGPYNWRGGAQRIANQIAREVNAAREKERG